MMAYRIRERDLKSVVEYLATQLPAANIRLEGANDGWQILAGGESSTESCRALTHGYRSKRELYEITVAMTRALDIRCRLAANEENQPQPRPER